MRPDAIKIAVIGPGAMGRLLAAAMSRAGIKVVLMDYKPERAARLNRHGIRIETGEDGNVEECRVVVSTLKSAPVPFDWTVIFVKTYQLEGVLEAVKRLSGRNGMVLSLQNGIGQEKLLAEAVSPERIAIGITANGAALYGDVVRHSGKGITVIGPLDKKNAAADSACRRFAGLLGHAGWECLAVQDIAPYRWKKLVANCAINPLTAVAGVKNGMLARDDNLKRIMLMAAEEAFDTALATGIDIGSRNEILAFVEDICIRTAGNRSSMLQDTDAGRRTEIDSINGAVIEMAGRHGLKAPVNSVLFHLVKNMEKRRENH